MKKEPWLKLSNLVNFLLCHLKSFLIHSSSDQAFLKHIREAHSSFYDYTLMLACAISGYLLNATPISISNESQQAQCQPFKGNPNSLEQIKLALLQLQLQMVFKQNELLFFLFQYPKVCKLLYIRITCYNVNN